MSRSERIAIVVLGLLLLAPVARAQNGVDPIARFESATALAADPFGNLYIIDQGAGTLIRLPQDGSAPESVGGPSSRVREPRAVDPTNGLLILVADGSTGRIHRFARSLAWTGELGIEPQSRQEPGAVESARSGRHTTREVGALVSTRTGSVFVLDASSRRLEVFDERNRLIRSIGPFETEGTVIVDPVALCTDGRDQVAVLDTGIPAIIFFDAFGSETHAMPLPVVPTSSSITCDGGTVRVHTDRFALHVTTDGVTRVSYPPGIDATVVATIRVGEYEYLLTERTLYRIAPMEYDVE